MWLINTETYQLKEFLADIPQYAILSHRWKEEEISHQEMRESSLQALEPKQGFRKIQKFCSIARSKRLDWAWCDTCCIDKKSSAELQESINSMYKWYRNSAVCIVYLQDVGNAACNDEIAQSEWFSRGWTLQELLAPTHLEFYDWHWNNLGTKKDHCSQIYSRTKIPIPILLYPQIYTLDLCSVADRMSWFQDRKTLRPEDIAYCLIGLFSVNIPLLYGEGAENAFYRLQCAIMDKTADQSIFVHSDPRSILATSPWAFQKSTGVISKPGGSGYHDDSTPFIMTSKGLHGEFPLASLPLKFWTDFVIIPDFSISAKRDAAHIDEVATDRRIYIVPLKCEQNGEPLMLNLVRSYSDTNVYHKVRTMPLNNNVRDALRAKTFKPESMFLRGTSGLFEINAPNLGWRDATLSTRLRQELLRRKECWKGNSDAFPYLGFKFLETYNGARRLVMPEEYSISFDTFVRICKLPAHFADSHRAWGNLRATLD